MLTRPAITHEEKFVAQSDTRRLRFTLADDEPQLLYLMGYRLAQAYPGCDISTFSSGEDALAHIMEFGTDILVTDNALGRMSGIQLIREVRRHYLNLPIVMFCGDAEAEKSAEEAGVTTFLNKDLGFWVFSEQIQKLLPKSTNITEDHAVAE